MIHKLPRLPYALDALEPDISKRTLELHHGKHHRGYVKKLNELIQGTPHAEQSLEEILRSSDGPIYDNAAQHFNHSLYWRCLSPELGVKPSKELKQAIEQSFGSLPRLAKAFTERAAAQFGSGWCWLVRQRSGSLSIEATSNARVPLKKGARPVLTCNVWEHAYYVDYQNDRAKYLKRFWARIDWTEVERQWSDEAAFASIGGPS